MIVADIEGVGSNRQHIIGAVHQGARNRAPVNQLVVPIIKDFNKLAIPGMIHHKNR